MPYQKPNGEWSRYPLSREDAIRRKSNKYDDSVYCPTCDVRPHAKQRGGRCTVKYTANNKCVNCANLEAVAFYNWRACGLKWNPEAILTNEIRRLYDEQAITRFDPTPCDKAGHVGALTDDGRCWLCVENRANTLTPRQAAVAAGQKWYTPDTPCPRCGTTAQRRVDNGRCSGCQPNRQETAHSPRQAAIAAGRRWYTPTDPCPRCGTTALRSVANGRCQGCHPIVSDRKDMRSHTTNQQIIEACPDMVISRDDARTAGMGIYRTGRPCKRGHTGWRYVKGGACIDCHNERG